MKRLTTPTGGVLLITSRMQHGAEQLQIKEKKTQISSFMEPVQRN